MSANLTVLSPNTPTASPVQPSSVATVTLSESDVRTLRRALRVIEVARADAKSQDQEVAKEASRRLADVLYYLAGFLDAKSMTTALDGGFQSIFQSSLVTTQDPEKLLDDIQKGLADALEPGGTRIIPLIVAGAIIAGAGLIALGAYLKTL